MKQQQVSYYLKKIYFAFIYFQLNLVYSQSFVFAELTGSPTLNTAGWNLTGNAVVGNTNGTSNNDADELVLTQNMNGQSGGIFWNQPLNLEVCNKWIVEFDFRMFDGNAADGIAFCFLDVPPAGFVAGGGIGIPGSANGLKVVLDTYNNCGGPNPEIQIFSGVGYNECAPGIIKLENNGGLLNFVRNNNYQRCIITYDDGQITVSINGTIYLTGFAPASFIGYMGFTASTGGFNDRHSIKDVIIYTDQAASNAGADVSICNGEQAVIGATPNSNYLYSWSPTNGLSDPTVANPSVSINNNDSMPLSVNFVVQTSFAQNPGVCPTFDTVSVTIHPHLEVFESVTSCENYTWPTNNVTYNQSGQYSELLNSSAGCDSIVTLDLTIVNPNFTNVTVAACNTYLWSVNGQTYTSSGTYTEMLQTQFGCDSTLVLELTINESVISTETLSTCESYTWPVNGQTYTGSGIYTEVLQTQFGCDSTLVLELTINESITTNETLSACDSYTWPVNGQTYTSSGTYTEVLQTQFGCDSTLILDLTINESVTSTQTLSSCDTYTWSVNGLTYATSGTYTEVLQTQFGCDSTLILELTINESVTSTQNLSSCDSYTWFVNGQTYASTGTYTEVLQTQLGCDSILVLELTINETLASNQSYFACYNYTWPLNGQTYTNSGTYTELLQTQLGCDSLVTLNLTIHSSNSSQTQVTACDNFTWNGQTYTQSGIYSYQTTNGNGCDSIAWLNLTINNSVQTQELIRVCEPEDEKVLVLEYATIQGCDSIHTVVYEAYSQTELPIASFSTSPTSTVLLPPGLIQTYNNSQNASSFLWSFGDGSNSMTEANPNHIYKNEGQFVITLVANNATNCPDTSMQLIIVQEDLLIYVPNTFTPDGDSYNGVFLPIINGDYDPYNYTLLIFNRWGEVVFESRNAQIGWDGTYGGNIVENGTYIWKIKVQSRYRDDPKEFVGHVSLLK